MMTKKIDKIIYDIILSLGDLTDRIFLLSEEKLRRHLKKIAVKSQRKCVHHNHYKCLVILVDKFVITIYLLLSELLKVTRIC